MVNLAAYAVAAFYFVSHVAAVGITYNCRNLPGLPNDKFDDYTP
jgi:hypothetical protein